MQYIQVDETHRIEITPSRNFYPQYRSNVEGGYSYYKKGNKQKKFGTEAGAHRFLLTDK